jgi:2-methylcitrate dehydratase PrpD
VRVGVETFGRGESALVGSAARVAEPAAALVNATAAHVHDFDDNFHPAAAHASAVLVPALLAVAESEDRSGLALLDAYVVGLEVMGRIGEAVNFEHYERGWHATSTLGAIAAGGACARLLGLDRERLRCALSLAVSMAGGSKRQFGTMAKPVHAGLAAHHGVIAARLASKGVQAAAEPLDGRFGFRDLFAAGSPGFESVQAKVGAPLAIEEYGLMVKPHPCCASVHCTADAVRDLMREHRLTPADIERIDTYVPSVAIDHLIYPTPKDEREARFSMQYAVALIVERGAMKLADFKPGAIGDPAITRWSDRIHMHARDSVRPHPTPPNVLEPAEVEIRLRDGSTVGKLVRYARGVLQNPLSEEERALKFADCASGVVDPARLRVIAQALASLEEAPSIRPLMKLLQGPPDR